ncbi:FCD domain-containing protein [Plastorhodobacter daqingensis]|uniref:FCD domain-containing protein n=1 Tax=Plastorhodobacter daqingensis TaxID=1387281 RepID=A0ABW2UHV1_9RHOB
MIAWEGRRRTVLRLPQSEDRFDRDDLVPEAERLERRFPDWILRRDGAPRTRLNISELSRQFDVGPQAAAGFLGRFSRLGPVERIGRSDWALRGFAADHARELPEFRMMIELDAARRFASLPASRPAFARLEHREAEHLALLDRIDTACHDFSALDVRLHPAVTGITGNRFARDFRDLISFIFHHHNQWNKRLEQRRNTAAIADHPEYIRPLRSRDKTRILRAAEGHLTTARQTLLD